jgi:hypothetical protein
VGVSLAVIDGGKDSVAIGRVSNRLFDEIYVMKDLERRREPERDKIFIVAQLSQCSELLETVVHPLTVCHGFPNSPYQSYEDPGTEVLT